MLISFISYDISNLFCSSYSRYGKNEAFVLPRYHRKWLAVKYFSKVLRWKAKYLTFLSLKSANKDISCAAVRVNFGWKPLPKARICRQLPNRVWNQLSNSSLKIVDWHGQSRPSDGHEQRARVELIVMIISSNLIWHSYDNTICLEVYGKKWMGNFIVL